jgi:hypothetical protein
MSLLTACSDKTSTDAPAPADPTPAFQLSSYFGFTTPTPGGGTAQSGYGTGHSSRDIKGVATLQPQVLVLDFTAGTDDVHFEVDRTSLGTGWANTYALRSRNQPNAPVFSSYVYSRPNDGAAIYRFSDFANDLAGGVTITTYDAKRQLVSGSFKVLTPNQRDPLAKGLNDPTCTITLEGSFENLKVKVQ